MEKHHLRYILSMDEMVDMVKSTKRTEKSNYWYQKHNTNKKPKRKRTKKNGK